jgi:putative transposase
LQKFGFSGLRNSTASVLSYPLAIVSPMRVKQAFRYELDPTNSQRTALAKHAGAARYAYNWGLAERKRRLDSGTGSTNAIEQNRQWNIFKRANAPWWVEASKCAPQEALRDLDRAMNSFFASRNKKSRRRVGFPKFKSKGISDSFRLTGQIRIGPRFVQLPRLRMIRTKESTAKLIASRAEVSSASVRREADRWFVSLTVEVERPDPARVQGPNVGIDRGLTRFAVCSDGSVIESSKALQRGLRKLRQLSKSLSRKKKGSKNRDKAKLRLARHHRRIRNQRKDALHKATTHLAKTKQVIVVENLNVSGMIRNRHLSRAISDAGWAQFTRQLSYKCQWYGSTLVVADRYFPSTKTCSGCGDVAAEIPLSQRVFACGSCGLSVDRDLNAAINLERYVAVSSTETLNGCGEGSASQTGNGLVKLPSVKQEPDSKGRESFV